MNEFTVDELSNRLLTITQKMQLVIDNKQWAMLDHFMLERNDVLELLEPFRGQFTPSAQESLQEAILLQEQIMSKMESNLVELKQVISFSHQASKVNRKYQEQFITGNVIHGNL